MIQCLRGVVVKHLVEGMRGELVREWAGMFSV
jgi:hypothetical protein